MSIFPDKDTVIRYLVNDWSYSLADAKDISNEIISSAYGFSDERLKRMGEAILNDDSNAVIALNPKQQLVAYIMASHIKEEKVLSDIARQFYEQADLSRIIPLLGNSPERLEIIYQKVEKMRKERKSKILPYIPFDADVQFELPSFEYIKKFYENKMYCSESEAERRAKKDIAEAAKYNLVDIKNLATEIYECGLAGNERPDVNGVKPDLMSFIDVVINKMREKQEIIARAQDIYYNRNLKAVLTCDVDMANGVFEEVNNAISQSLSDSNTDDNSDSKSVSFDFSSSAALR